MGTFPKLGDFDHNQNFDVPTMLRLLSAIYDNVRDDAYMEDVAELVLEAMYTLSATRNLAHKVMVEADVEQLSSRFDDQFCSQAASIGRKLC